MKNLVQDRRLSCVDITGNRSGDFNEGRMASEPTRQASLDPLVAVSPYGDDKDMEMSAGDEWFDELEDQAMHFNSRLDLSHDLPSTRCNRFTAQNQRK